MKIAITINDVIRSFYDTFKQVYQVYQEEEEAFINSLDENDYEFKNLDADGQESEVDFTDKNEKIILDLHGVYDPMYLTREFQFETKSDFFSFLYSQMAFEIFAKTSISYKDAMMDLHQFQQKCEDHGIELTLLSMERNNSKPATLFFLSREKCKVNNIRFVDSYSEIWKDYDLIVTADNYIAETKPLRKKLILVETKHNTTIKSRNKIKSLSEIDQKWKTIKK